MTKTTPTVLDTVDRVVVIGDVHGDIAMLSASLFLADLFNTNLEWVAKPQNTIVVQMGDQLDSLSRDTTQEWEKVEDSKLIEFTEKLDMIARKKGGRFISIIGNHEIMNLTGNFSYVSPFSMGKSGGNEGRLHRYKPGGFYAKILANRNIIQKIGPLLFCHAGLLPHHLNLVNEDIDKINKLFSKMATNEITDPEEMSLIQDLFMSELSILWNRIYLNQDNPNMDNILLNTLQRTECNHMMIGHNPMPQITPLYNFKLWLTDVGLSRSFSNENLEVLEILNGGSPIPENNYQPFRVLRAVKK